MAGHASVDEISILHFNDVYHISDPELVARFATVLSEPHHITGSHARSDRKHLRVFSGDVFSPSLEASVLQGEHMIDLLNGLQIDVACYGNHDFDFGEDRLSELSKSTTFPWTMSNIVREPEVEGRNQLLAQSQEYVVKEIENYRIGFFGLAGTDWPSNCQHLPSCDILDPAIVARRVASYLRSVEKCHLVIALTHLRLIEDLKVSEATLSSTERVDLLLGGHDHHVLRRTATDTDSNPEHLHGKLREQDAVIFDHEGDVRIIKSGTNWRGLSVVNLSVCKDADGHAAIRNVKLRQVTDLKRLPNYEDIIPKPETLSIIAKSHSQIEQIVQKPILHTSVALDGRSRVVRGQETNIGNMLSDALRAFYDTDIAFVNSGAIRCDRIIEVSTTTNQPLRIRDVVDINPFGNAMVVKRISGAAIATALENSVSDAHTDGRFLHPSGLRMTVDWNAPEGHRVSDVMYAPQAIDTNHYTVPQRLDCDQMYTVAMADFIAQGFDGYSCFVGAETVVDAEGAMTDTNLLLEVCGGSMSPTSSANPGEKLIDKHNAGIKRARKVIIHSYYPTSEDGFPVVNPVVDGRINTTKSVS